MAANTLSTDLKSGDELNTKISELNHCIDELDRMIKELQKRGGDRTEEEMEKIKVAIEFWNSIQMEVKNKLHEFELLCAFANGTRMLQISELNLFFEVLDDKVTELVPGETRLDEEMKKKREMQRGGGGESSSTKVPDDDDPGYLQNVQSIKRELDMLKETMKTFIEIVEIIQRTMNQNQFEVAVLSSSMAANSSSTVLKSGDEFNTKISELNRGIDELDRMIKELPKRGGGDRTEEETEKLNDAIEFFNGKKMEVKNKLDEFELLCAFANGTRMLQISEMNSFFEVLDGKVTELVPGETRFDEEMKNKREMQRGGGESSSTDVPGIDDPGYFQNVQSIKRELDILKEMMKTFTEVVEINLRSSPLPTQSKNGDSINTEPDFEISGGNVGAEVSKASGAGEECSGLTSKDETNIEGFDLGDDTTSSEELERDSAVDVENEEAGEVENEGDDTSSSEDANDNDPMNNTIGSSLYTNIPGLADETNELMRKLEEEGDNQPNSNAPINLKNLRSALRRRRF